MPKVSAFSVHGLKVFFHSYEHEPPHFHVQKAGSWEIRVYIETSYKKYLHYEYKYQISKEGLNRNEKNEILMAVLNNKENLLKEWESKVNLGK